jgi:hypothetical protein
MDRGVNVVPLVDHLEPKVVGVDGVGADALDHKLHFWPGAMSTVKRYSSRLKRSEGLPLSSASPQAPGRDRPRHV